MLSPNDFNVCWGDDSSRLQPFQLASVERLAISQHDKDFLLQTGLPEAAAPFLAFRAPTAGELPTVAEEWRQPKEFAVYRVIGSDGSGNPVALDERNGGEVVILDHENRFARVLMNSSVRQL